VAVDHVNCSCVIVVSCGRARLVALARCLAGFASCPRVSLSDPSLPALAPLLSSSSPPAVELPIGTKVSLGRKTSAHLNNLHISREQVHFELKPDLAGRILICMTNVRRAAAAAAASTS
jgi:hypothetical protein